MRHYVSALAITLPIFFVSCSPSLSVEGKGYTLSAPQLSSNYSGATWNTPLSISFLSDGVLFSTAEDSVTLTPYLDSGCGTPASGSFTVAQNPVPLNAGVATFSGLSYTWHEEHQEGKLYLKASTSKFPTSNCIGPIPILRKFNEGYGWYRGGPTSLSGAADASMSEGMGHVRIDPKGRYVACGSSKNAAGTFQYSIRRMLPDGTPDSTFGTNGVLVGPTTGVAGGTGANLWDYLGFVLFDKKGRTVVFGYSKNNDGGSERVMLRLTESGTLDPTFGSGGAIRFLAPGITGATGAGHYESAGGGFVDSLGRFVVSGYAKDSAGGRRFAIWRILEDGTPDSSFGTNGATYWNGTTGVAGATGANIFDIGPNITEDAEGRYVIAGRSKTSSGGQTVVFWRYLNNGTPDTIFGNGGALAMTNDGDPGAAGATGAAQFDTGNGIVIDSQGRYWTGGFSQAAVGRYWVVWRVLPSGVKDPSFGNNGVLLGSSTGLAGATGANLYDYIYRFSIDQKGRPIGSGWSKSATGAFEMTAWRFLETGALDPSFGTNGVVLLGSPGITGTTGAAQDDDGWFITPDEYNRYIISGTSKNTNGGYEFAMWRLLENGALDK